MRLNTLPDLMRWCAAAACLGALAGCANAPHANGAIESFDATDRFSRKVTVGADAVCGAARLALLSQGYLVNSVQADEIRGRKNFQPDAGSHAEMEVRVVCAPTGPQEASVFVSALQERYELKKSSNSASLGLGALGSVSLPFSLGNDSMVRVSSETVTSPRFYDRFFEVLERYLGGVATTLPSGDADGGATSSAAVP